MKAKLLISIILVTVLLSLSACAGGESCSVTFDAKGGVFDGDTVVKVKPESTVELPTPSREGYVFIGWYVGEGANEVKFKATDRVTADIKLNAKWINEEDILNNGVKIEIHTVKFNANGGSLTGEETIYAQTYSMINLPTPTMEGYVFLGWYVGEGANEALFTSSNLVTANITLTAKWAKSEHTVTFIDYYGEVLARETVKYGEEANAPVVPRIADRCLRFDAWDTDISSVTADMEVKALYVIDAYTITYVTGTNQTIPTTSYFFGETPVLPPEPAMAGHYFIGWYLDREYTDEYLFDTPLTEDITLYAFFNESIPISTIEELLAIPEYDASNYFLKNDIDCEGAVITGQIIGFTGTFDGCGHKISNFVYHPVAAAQNGLFASNGGTIKNIYFDEFSFDLFASAIHVGFLTGNNTGTIENVHISNATLSYANSNCNSYFGAIAGENKGEVRNCSVVSCTTYFETQSESWSSSGTKVGKVLAGALVGTNAGNISECNTQTVSTFNQSNVCSNTYRSGNESYVLLGGLVSVNSGSIKNCDAVYEVAGGSTNNYRYHQTRVGGFIDWNSGEIEGCSAELKVNCSASLSYFGVGGFVDVNEGTVKNCYASIDVTNSVSSSIFGGFVSENKGGIDRCYAKGTMNVGAATLGKGGFAGYNDGSINSCFADVSITATDAAKYGPFIGSNGTATYVENCYYSIKCTFGINGQPHTFTNPQAEVGDPVLNFSNTEFLANTLGWSEEMWDFDENQLFFPTLRHKKQEHR